MNKKIFVMVGLLMLLLASCSPEAVMDTPVPQQDTFTPAPIEEPIATPSDTPELTVPLTLEETADRVINALADKDLEAVAEFVHPEIGVRLSPYAYVEESHLVFMPDELPGLVGSDEILMWGYFDGSGDPIELTFDAYYDRFLFSADFTNPEAMAVNKVLGFGNSLNNIADFYPGASFVEYHFSGFEEDYGGMDWVSLRLVFIQEDGVWFLVGMVKDQWTI